MKIPWIAISVFGMTLVCYLTLYFELRPIFPRQIKKRREKMKIPWIAISVFGMTLVCYLTLYFELRPIRWLREDHNLLCPTGFKVETEDLLCKKPIMFNTTFKNPCWYDDTRRLKCLPYFVIAGMTKCGTTDLYDSIKKHPDFESAMFRKGLRKDDKEIHFFDRRHFEDSTRSSTYTSLSDYFNCFSSVAERIVLDGSFDSTITGEATPGYFWRFYNWINYPQNKKLAIPRFVIPDLLHHLIPNVKVVLIFREPAERTRSHFFFFRNGKGTEEEFNDHIDKELKEIEDCFRGNTLNYCMGLSKTSIYRDLDMPKNCIRPSMYAYFLKEWFRVFPRRQFYFISLEDYQQDKQSELNRLFDFLTLRRLSGDEMIQRNISFTGKVNKGPSAIDESKTDGTMKKLRNFFLPFNQEFVKHVGENKFKSFLYNL